ncbi:MAG TPA: MauE/DoxX family redox-associated membrane protein [Polyangia bacterium]|jgi:putative oxidoreductase|nr:MauE/DoxX family redox-associated membrane protein [Polyangia bacterium]
MRALFDWRGHAIFALAARLYLAAIFLFACWHKILQPAAFALDIATYQILPLGLVNPLAIVLPWVELVAGLMLLLGFRTRAAALLVAGMMAMFTVAIAIAVAKGLDMSCGCFASQGSAEDPISWRTILRDLSWLLLAAYVFIFDRRPIGLDRLLGRRKNASAQEPS